MSSKLKQLSSTLYLTNTNRDSSIGKSQRKYSMRLHEECRSARDKYQDLTNLSKDNQKHIVWAARTTRRSEWKHDHYKVNNTFEVIPNHDFVPFPHNNRKYNMQFLEKSLHGRNLRFPSKELGYFQKPRDKLFTNHYKPIVQEKRKYNEDYQLRTSLFSQTWVDAKKERLLDEYKLQANPFRTPASNTILSTLHKENNYRKL